MFDNCTQSIFKTCDYTMTPKEIIRLGMDLLDFSLRYYPGQMDHISHCLGVCAAFLQGEDTHGDITSEQQ